MKQKKDKKEIISGGIAIYKSASGPKLEVRFKNETIWLTQKQIADLFDVNIPAISKHIRNIYNEGELSQKSTVSKMETVRKEGSRLIKRKLEFFNLDVIIAAGYRVNSKRATQFRIWATKTLKNHLVQGYTLNEKRLFEEGEKLRKLQETIVFLQQKSKAKMLKGQEKEILDLLADYSKTLTILEQYDKNKLRESKEGKSVFVLEYEECKRIIFELKKELMAKKEAGNLFGNERDGAFESIVKNLYQTFGGKQLYANLESKAAHLLYLIIKDHPFSDGNKRTAAFLFVYFLDANNYLFRKNGERKVNDNALAALALLVAQSDPKEKNQMIALITQLLK